MIDGKRQQWLKERRNGIGASEAASILGLSPFKSNLALWEEKVGIREPEDISEKPYVKYGTEAEKYLRGLFALDYPQYTIGYEEFKIIRHPQYPFLFATLDGELSDNGSMGVYEGKTTEIMRQSDWDKWEGRIPDNYYIQCLHQMLVTGWAYAWLRVQIKYTVNGDRRAQIRDYYMDRAECKSDIAHLLERELSFWESIKFKKRPALLLPPI